jgi:hypothetical protein
VETFLAEQAVVAQQALRERDAAVANLETARAGFLKDIEQLVAENVALKQQSMGPLVAAEHEKVVAERDAAVARADLLASQLLLARQAIEALEKAPPRVELRTEVPPDVAQRMVQLEELVLVQHAQLEDATAEAGRLTTALAEAEARASAAVQQVIEVQRASELAAAMWQEAAAATLATSVAVGESNGKPPVGRLTTSTPSRRASRQELDPQHTPTASATAAAAPSFSASQTPQLETPVTADAALKQINDALAAAVANAVQTAAPQPATRAGPPPIDTSEPDASQNVQISSQASTPVMRLGGGFPATSAEAAVRQAEDAELQSLRARVQKLTVLCADREAEVKRIAAELASVKAELETARSAIQSPMSAGSNSNSHGQAHSLHRTPSDSSVGSNSDVRDLTARATALEAELSAVTQEVVAARVAKRQADAEIAALGKKLTALQVRLQLLYR